LIEITLPAACWIPHRDILLKAVGIAVPVIIYVTPTAAGRVGWVFHLSAADFRRHGSVTNTRRSSPVFTGVKLDEIHCDNC